MSGDIDGVPMTYVVGWKSAFVNQKNVLHALILHDIKSRFFGNGWGYVVMILWPGAHLALVVSIHYFSGRVGYGTSTILYSATGVLPYICWNYISRFSMMSALQNRQYLQYPQIKFLDLTFARIFLEIVTCSIVTFVLFAIFFIMQIDATPVNPGQAFFGLMSAVNLGVGFGVLGAVISRLFPLFNVVYILFLITFWLASGVTINPEGLPESIGYYFSFNPLLHCVEWIRSAYYVDYPHRLLDKNYVISVGLITLALGLCLERLLRRFGS
jgi:capsular polysaccharide transport system permease protein